MKYVLLGILADTHDELARTRRAVSLLRDAGAEALIHCGDLANATIIEACAELPLWFALGNHDADSALELRTSAARFGAICVGWGGVVELAGKRIAVAHGHLSTIGHGHKLAQRSRSMTPQSILV